MTTFRSVCFACLALAALAGCKEDDVVTFESLEAQKDAYSERIADIEDATLRDLLGIVAGDLYRRQADALWVAQPLDNIQYTTNPFAWIDAYPSIDDMAAQYVAGVFAFTNPNSFRGDVDPRRPFIYPFPKQLTWSEVVLSDGTVAQVNNDPFVQSQTGFDARNEGWHIRTVAEGSDLLMPVQVKGQVELMVPSKVTRLTFASNDLGQSQTFGNITVTMTQVSERSVTFDVTDSTGEGNVFARNPMVVSATDATGSFLNSNASSRGPVDAFNAALVEVFDVALASAEAGKETPTDIEAQLRSDFAEVNEQFSSNLTIRTQFEGRIETVELLLAIDAKPQVFPLDLQVFLELSQVNVAEGQAAVDIPNTAAIYAHEYEYLTAPDVVKELSPDALDNAITSLSTIFWNGQEQVKFYYPPDIASNVFGSFSGRIQDESAQIRFLDNSGNAVAPQPTFEFQPGRVDFVVAETGERPTQATGAIDMRLLPNLSIETYAADALPDGVSIVGNQVIRPITDARYFAIDDQGRFLRKFHDTEVRDGWDVQHYVDYYYGAPTGVVMVTRGEAEIHPYQFAIDLVELMPE